MSLLCMCTPSEVRTWLGHFTWSGEGGVQNGDGHFTKPYVHRDTVKVIISYRTKINHVIFVPKGNNRKQYNINKKRDPYQWPPCSSLCELLNIYVAV